MRSAESFVAEVHRRAAVLCRVNEKKQIAFLSCINGSLFAALLIMIGSPHRMMQTALTGTSLLDECTGGYVAVAVAAFMLGAAAAVGVRRLLKRKTAEKAGTSEEQT